MSALRKSYGVERESPAAISAPGAIGQPGIDNSAVRPSQDSRNEMRVELTMAKPITAFQPDIAGDETLLECIREMRQVEELQAKARQTETPTKPERPLVVLAPVLKGTNPGSSRVLSAARIRCEAEANSMARPDSLHSADHAHADKIETAALAVMGEGEFELSVGGELIPHGTGHNLPAHYRNTVQAPSFVTAEASRTRLDLADQCGVPETTLDLCDTIEARDSTERMLAGQMALLNKVTMKAGKRAAECLDYMEGAIDRNYRQAMSVQANRMVNSFARASAEFQNCMATLQRRHVGVRLALMEKEDSSGFVGGMP